MFELPECLTLARQMNKTLRGKTVARGQLGNSPHKFVWYNLKPAEFAANIKGKTVGKAYTRGRWLFVPVGDGHVLVFGECGGKILLHESSSVLPKKYHLSLRFNDGTALSATTQMWGAMELYEKGKELERQYIKGMRRKIYMLPWCISKTGATDMAANLTLNLAPIGCWTAQKHRLVR